MLHEGPHLAASACADHEAGHIEGRADARREVRPRPTGIRRAPTRYRRSSTSRANTSPSSRQRRKISPRMPLRRSTSSTRSCRPRPRSARRCQRVPPIFVEAVETSFGEREGSSLRPERHGSPGTATSSRDSETRRSSGNSPTASAAPPPCRFNLSAASPDGKATS